jgi:hypothetical protein
MGLNPQHAYWEAGERYARDLLGKRIAAERVIAALVTSGWKRPDAERLVEETARKLGVTRAPEPVPPPHQPLTPSGHQQTPTLQPPASPPPGSPPPHLSRVPDTGNGEATDTALVPTTAADGAQVLTPPAEVVPVVVIDPTPSAELTISGDLLDKFPTLKPQVEALLGKMRDAWTEWAKHPEECHKLYAQLRGEAQKWAGTAHIEGSRGKWLLTAVLALGGLFVALAIGAGMAFLDPDNIPTVETWLALSGLGLAAGGLVGLIVCWIRRPRAVAPPPEAIQYAERLREVHRRVLRDFPDNVRGACRDFRRKIEAFHRQADDVAEASGVSPGQVPILVDSVADLLAELHRVEETSAAHEKSVREQTLSKDIKACRELPSESPARGLEFVIPDPSGREISYRAANLRNAQDHLQGQARQIQELCRGLRESLEMAADGDAAEAAAKAKRPDIPAPVNEHDLGELHDALRSAHRVLERHASQCIRQVETWARSMQGLRARFNESARMRRWTVRV